MLRREKVSTVRPPLSVCPQLSACLNYCSPSSLCLPALNCLPVWSQLILTLTRTLRRERRFAATVAPQDTLHDLTGGGEQPGQEASQVGTVCPVVSTTVCPVVSTTVCPAVSTAVCPVVSTAVCPVVSTAVCLSQLLSACLNCLPCSCPVVLTNDRSPRSRSLRNIPDHPEEGAGQQEEGRPALDRRRRWRLLSPSLTLSRY